MSGMISLRMDGASISEIVGAYLGPAAKQVMRVFSLILLVLLGAVFTTSPAALIARLTPEWMNTGFWVVVILAYYLLATLLPIDKLIGKLYPIFGAVLLMMAVGIVVGLTVGGYQLPELTLANLHPEGRPIWPYMFITVACGAISGFHGTQSPMMARCLTSEKDGRKIFYGAMISESVIALVWAAAMYLVHHGARPWHSLLCALPAAFMSGVSCTYILMAEEGFRLSSSIAYPVGIAFAAVCTAVYGYSMFKRREQHL